ncbi:MAG: nucleotide-binding protein [Promethearchaeota archaeon]
MIFPISQLQNLFDPKKSILGLFSIYGNSGVGKTTLALQTAILYSKMGKNVLYFYSKPKIPVEKINALLEDKKKEELDDIIEKIIIIKINNFYNLYNISFNLEFLILNRINMKERIPHLIIIDSITDLYRIELNRDYKKENTKLTYKLNQILANLFFLNKTYNTEILLVNESTHINQGDKVLEVQSGGKVMEYWTNYSIKISRADSPNKRTISLVKSPTNNFLEFSSFLTKQGFR